MSKTSGSVSETANPFELPLNDEAFFEAVDLQRKIEAILFASAEPIGTSELSERLRAAKRDVEAAMDVLVEHYAKRGVVLRKIAERWAFRTADDLKHVLHREAVEQKRLSRAALETLAIIAFHQPVTRAEIEEIRGVSTSKGTLDVLMETGWVRMRGRRRTPGRPVTYGTTTEFLDHFGLESIRDLPGLDELKGSGLLDSAIPASFKVPVPDDNSELSEDEDPLDEDDLFALSEGEEEGGATESKANKGDALK
ncbi:SMC-Scp complex subunit ScpB [Pseudovibrio sp. SPO723]|uniref:SMC-Scp complex subunit ScpB n=1 Tax=Nesiotobacter zosterae TaxID=392721 RepID=UPI0029C49A39|nr:SMC-Scp complex subunit ScpB [Pseudovibrio sp. SPO723]MDX5592815.1 SMC-Scp complex subunit ScpB [Pseudovibrio sp. SPO723]